MDNQSKSQPLRIHSDTVKSEWIDYNGHMNDGYYVVAFTYATDALQDWVGFDAGYRDSTSCSIYTVEAHLQYLKEVKVNARLDFSTYVLGVDHKRIHLLHAMYAGEDNYLAATHELMLLHVSQHSGKTVSMPEEIQQTLGALAATHRSLKRPVETGRAIQAVR